MGNDPVQVSDAQDANGRYKGPAGWPYGVVKKYEKAVWHLGRNGGGETSTWKTWEKWWIHGEWVVNSGEWVVNTS